MTDPSGAAASPYVSLSYEQVGLAAALILINAALSLLLRLGLERRLLWAAVRMVVQLALIGQVLRLVFEANDWRLVLLMMLVMVVVAGTAAVSRTNRRYRGIWLDSLLAVWASSWLIAGIGVVGIVQVRSWYVPQYAIPLLGMILGNSLNGVSLGLDRFNEELSVQRQRVEALLTLGATRWEAARLPIQQAVRTGTIPIINSMVVAGIVSLPGMMTGQLLSGVDPMEAVKYQMVIMFLIASGAALGTVGVVLLCYRRLFNAYHQFLYWRITDKDEG